MSDDVLMAVLYFLGILQGLYIGWYLNIWFRNKYERHND